MNRTDRLIFQLADDLKWAIVRCAFCNLTRTVYNDVSKKCQGCVEAQKTIDEAKAKLDEDHKDI